mmetsp:Transcript_38011/g.56537  ORF Transcript_38011/g.56537 Transcript_38011/m.56537 type:complete len:96 (+) Transcript_38011:333-620(+)
MLPMPPAGTAPGTLVLMPPTDWTRRTIAQTATSAELSVLFGSQDRASCYTQPCLLAMIEFDVKARISACGLTTSQQGYGGRVQGMGISSTAVRAS